MKVSQAAETFAEMAGVPGDTQQLVEDAFVAGAAALAALLEDTATDALIEELLEELEDLTAEMCERRGFDMPLPSVQ